MQFGEREGRRRPITIILFEWEEERERDSTRSGILFVNISRGT
jgi:hypothetical protein